jgi:hypothetical protein
VPPTGLNTNGAERSQTVVGPEIDVGVLLESATVKV